MMTRISEDIALLGETTLADYLSGLKDLEKDACKQLIEEACSSGFASLYRHIEHPILQNQARDKIFHYIFDESMNSYKNKQTTTFVDVTFKIDEVRGEYTTVFRGHFEIGNKSNQCHVYLVFGKDGKSEPIYLTNKEQNQIKALSSCETLKDIVTVLKKLSFVQIGKGGSKNVYSLNKDTVLQVSKNGEYKIHYSDYLGVASVVIPILLFTTKSGISLSVAPKVTPLNKYIEIPYDERSEPITLNAYYTAVKDFELLMDRDCAQTDAKLVNFAINTLITRVGREIIINHPVRIIDLQERDKDGKLATPYTPIYQPTARLVFLKEMELKHDNYFLMNLEAKYAMINTLIQAKVGSIPMKIWNSGYLKDSTVDSDFCDYDKNFIIEVARELFKPQYIDLIVNLLMSRSRSEYKERDNIITICEESMSLIDTKISEMLLPPDDSIRNTSSHFYKKIHKDKPKRSHTLPTKLKV